ncbi:hypothetical protein KR009_001993 [Drosophila setifemur]|nr:hypothetical protein KR009_001993 [Drosophila setifemur]
MSDNSAKSVVLNVLLCGATAFGIVKIGSPGDHPYAFTACVIGCCHGVLGLINIFAESDSTRSLKETTSSIMEIVPLPLVNVDLYLGAESNNIALGHGLFIVPLAISVILGMVKGEGQSTDDYGTLHTLKTLTILGNITSLLYLAINESSWNLAGMAFLAFMAKFGARFCEEQVSDGSGEVVTYVSWSGFFFLGALALSGEK